MEKVLISDSCLLLSLRIMQSQGKSKKKEDRKGKEMETVDVHIESWYVLG